MPRICRNRCKNFVRQLPPVSVQNCQFFSLRQAGRFHARIGKITVQAPVLVIKQFIVGPVKVKSQCNRLSDTPVLKLGLAQVESKHLQHGRVIMSHFLFDYPAFFNRTVVISGNPDFGNIFFPYVYTAGKQGLQSDSRILIIVKTNFVKVKKALAAGQIFRPVIRIPPENQIPSRFIFFQSVRAAAERNAQ